jgi:hypothetical protein
LAEICLSLSSAPHVEYYRLQNKKDVREKRRSERGYRREREKEERTGDREPERNYKLRQERQRAKRRAR